MKNVSQWSLTKFEIKAGKLRSSKAVSAGSRIMGECIARKYDDALAKHAKGRLLDLGCGTVPLYECYKTKVSSVTCVDWAESEHENNHLDHVCDLNAVIPLNANSFDTVILSDVLEHIYEPRNLVSEISRLLDIDGILILNTPFYYWLHEEPHDYFRYTKYSLTRFAEDFDLEIIQIEEIGGPIEIIGDLITKLVVRIPIVGHVSAVCISALTLFLGTVMEKTRFIKKLKAKFPFGYFVVCKRVG